MFAFDCSLDLVIVVEGQRSLSFADDIGRLPFAMRFVLVLFVLLRLRDCWWDTRWSVIRSLSLRLLRCISLVRPYLLALSLSLQVYQKRYPIESISTLCHEDVTEFETILFSFSSDWDLRKETNRCATMHCRRQKFRWSAKCAVYPPTSLVDSLDMDRWWLIGDACSWVAVLFIGRFPEVVRTWVLTHII